MDIVTVIYLLRVFVWLIVCAFAWKYRNLPVGAIAVVSGTGNAMVAEDQLEVASLLFMVSLPAIAYMLIECVRRDAS